MRSSLFLGAVIAIAVGCTSFGSEADPPTTPTDAGSDSGIVTPPDGAVVSRPCAATSADVLFCADFESGPSMPPFTFKEALGSAEGTFSLVDAPARPGTKALRVTTTPTKGTHNVALFQDLGAVAKDVRYELEVDVRLVNVPLDYAALAAMTSTSKDFASFRGVAAHVDGTRLGMIAPPGQLAAVEAGRWYHVRLVVALSGSGSTTTIFLDGKEVDVRAEGADKGTSLDVRIGLFFTSTEGAAAEALFDNLVVRRAQ